MKRIFVLLLTGLTLMSLISGCAAGDAPAATGEQTAPAYNYPKIHDALSWEKINAFPIKSADMTEDELRQLCVDFFLYSKTALWTPDRDMSYLKTKDGKIEEVLAGTIYGGLPYMTLSSGNVYRLLDNMDQQTGVVDMTEFMEYPRFLGNQCSIGVYWGWGRVINSAQFEWSDDMVHDKGFLRVGPYTYGPLLSFTEGICDPSTIIAANGEQVMCQSYEAMKLADGLVCFGHVVMCTGAPVVVYNPDGTINPQESYLYISDQHSAWVEAVNEKGDTYLYKNYVQKKHTFRELLDHGYIPFTFGEFLGTDPVEETQCSFSHTGDTITPSQLRAGTVNANYGLSDAYAIIRDKDGNPVFQCVKRAEKAGTATLNFYKTYPDDAFDDYASGEYTVEILCQLSTGERLSIYTGTLVK